MFTTFEAIEPAGDWHCDVWGVLFWNDGRVGVWSDTLQMVVILNP